MRIEETYKLLREGKRITSEKLPHGVFIYYKQGKLYRSDTHMQFGYGNVDYDDWEIYEENSLQNEFCKCLAQNVDKDIRLCSIEDLIEKLREHSNRQIDENRKSSRRMDQLEERIRLLEKK